MFTWIEELQIAKGFRRHGCIEIELCRLPITMRVRRHYSVPWRPSMNTITFVPFSDMNATWSPMPGALLVQGRSPRTASRAEYRERALNKWYVALVKRGNGFPARVIDSYLLAKRHALAQSDVKILRECNCASYISQKPIQEASEHARLFERLSPLTHLSLR